MDQADKLKLTKFGFHLNLLGASFSLSVLGIIVSIIGIIGSIICFVLALVVAMDNVGTISIGAFIIMIPYLAMWILLKIKTNKKDIPGIERIGKVYSYVSGSLEIIAMIAVIIYYCMIVYGLSKESSYPSYDPDYPYYRPPPPPTTAEYAILIVYMIVAVIVLVFACLKIHGIKVENNKLVGIYLGFQYGLFVLYIIQFIISSVYNQFAIIVLIVGGGCFILDIGLTVILHSIRVDRENTAGTENAMKNL